ncbi:hypothetical protein [Spirosoma areae]
MLRRKFSAFYDNKEDSKTQGFAIEAGLVLTNTPPFNYPTLSQVNEAAARTSYEVEREEFIEEANGENWVCGLFKDGALKTLIRVENDEVETDKVTCIHFECGDDQAIIEFLQCLFQYCGSVIFYDDTGFTKLIKHVGG